MNARVPSAAFDGHDPQRAIDREIASARLTVLSYRWGVEADLQEVTLQEASRVPFEEAVPVREPMAYQGQWSKPGYYLMARTGQLTSYESRFEAAHLLLLDLDPGVVAVTPQPFRLHWNDDLDHSRSHVPDFFVRRSDGSAEVVDVKGSRRASLPDNALVFGVTERACREMRMAFRIAGDIPPVTLANHRWLAGYRFATERVAELAPPVIDAAEHSKALHVLVQHASADSGEHPARIKTVIFHLLWAGLLHCDLNVPLNGTTTIHRNAQSVIPHVA